MQSVELMSLVLEVVVIYYEFGGHLILLRGQHPNHDHPLREKEVAVPEHLGKGSEKDIKEKMRDAEKQILHKRL